MLSELLEHSQIFIVGLIAIASAIIIGLFLQALLFYLLRSITRKTQKEVGSIITKHLRWPLRVLFPLILISTILPLLSLPQEAWGILKYINSSLFIVNITWLIIKIISSTTEIIKNRFAQTLHDSLRARKLFTQLQIIRRILTILIILLALAIILLQFEQIANIGTTILASAGVIGIIIGFAAQRSIATLFAGFQIAFSQPIRLDDVVVVENEWGSIEEITLTYVVVRLWDLRRLILPITYFIEKPFQNWTRESTEILGTVDFYLDYSTPLAELRAKALELAKTDPNWNGRLCKLEVTGTTDKALEVRLVVSADNSTKLWELRCRLREELISFINQNYPCCLPQIRSLPLKTN